MRSARRKDFLPWWQQRVQSHSPLSRLFCILHKNSTTQIQKRLHYYYDKVRQTNSKGPSAPRSFLFFYKANFTSSSECWKKYFLLNFFLHFPPRDAAHTRFLNARPPCSCRSDLASDFERLMMCCVLLVVETSASKREHYGLL